jgi:hypothetical protein
MPIYDYNQKGRKSVDEDQGFDIKVAQKTFVSIQKNYKRIKIYLFQVVELDISAFCTLHRHSL